MTPETRELLDRIDPALRRLEGRIEHGREQVAKLEQALADARDLRRRLLANERRLAYCERQGGGEQGSSCRRAGRGRTVSGDEPTPATVSVREAAYYLNMSPTTIRRGVRDGQILGYVASDGNRPSYRVDRQWLLDFAHLDDYPFEAIPFPPAAPPTHVDQASALARAMGRRYRKEEVR